MSITTGLRAAYNFTDNLWHDSTANALHLTANGGPSVSGGGAVLNGSGDFFTHADSALLQGGGQSFGIYVKFKMTSLAADANIVSKQGEYNLYYSQFNNQFRFSVFRNTGLETEVLAATITPTVGVTYLLAVWYDDSTKNLYLQDVANACSYSTAALSATGTNPATTNRFAIGRRDDSGHSASPGYFPGTVYTVMFWQRALGVAGDCETLANGGNGYEYTSTPDSCLNPFTFTGTKINDVAIDADVLSVRTHRQSRHAETPTELWYYRDSLWHLFPVQPLSGPENALELTQTYKQPATLGFTLPDSFGLYAPQNKNSGYNRNSVGTYDPLLDEARKICLRVGTKCYTELSANITPTSSLAVSAGHLYQATDGITGDIVSSIADYFQFTTADATPFTISLDLGAQKLIKHAIIRFASIIVRTEASLPASVQVSVSTDGTHYTDYPKRPIGGTGSAGVTPGDWDESLLGQTIDAIFCDFDITARYVKFTITPVTAQFIAIDELAVYGGNAAQILGCNLFTGYMGDQIDFNNAGQVKCLAVDVLKKLADNNDVRLTAAYRLTSAGAVELGDMVYSLLTSDAYWKSQSSYDSPLDSSEIGWSSGSGLTGLQFPLWQGQNNSILGYAQELFGVVGWNLYADGNGVIQATEPPYLQRLPDRVCIAANDGNYDVMRCERHRTGKQMRNRVTVETGRSKTSGSGTITLFDPNSIARYGTRTTVITDPLAMTTTLRQKVASHFLRDYAWNLQTLNNTIRPDYQTRLKQVFGLRAPARPNLYSAASTLDGDERLQELWSLVSIRHNIAYGQWLAECDWIPYVPQPVDAPNFTQLNQVLIDSTEMLGVLDAITDSYVKHVRVYVSTTSEFAGFTLNQTIAASQISFLISGLTASVPIWVYLTSVDAAGNESLPSQILSAIPGASSQTLTCYTITDFAISSILTDGPDASGYYTYQFLATWTAPLCGFTQSDIRAYVGASPPSNPDDRKGSWPLHDDSWNWWGPDRILANREFDNVTIGQLNFTITFRSLTNLSGLRIYFRIWNSARTRAWIPVEGNYAFCTVM